ncbi:DMBT1 protein, partial [Cochlearius cochlearius]|nr:DMBT1 protein [Cochlearius cochlearius]
QCEGHVEIFYKGTWGTICDDFWDISDAEVVCNQEVFGHALSALGNAHFIPGSRNIFLADVQCHGNESYLWECSHTGWSIHNCGHRGNARVLCSGTFGMILFIRGSVSFTAALSVLEISPWLKNGRNRCERHVELFYRGHRGTVCHDSWDISDAQATCKQLGCG